MACQEGAVCLDQLSDAAIDWARELLDRLADVDPADPDDLEYLHGLGFDVDPDRFACPFSLFEGSDLYLWHERDFDHRLVAGIMRELFVRFHPDRMRIVSWCWYHDTPVPSGFGGAAALVTADGIYWINPVKKAKNKRKRIRRRKREIEKSQEQ